MKKQINIHYNKLQTTIKTLPDKPGIYQYFDKEGRIIYIGKAKNIKKRVSSYFKKDKSISGKIAILIKKIYEIKFIIVDTEFDALLLENSLIKKYQPKYNVQLKDDKSYPWICIKNEPFPRVFPTRNIVKDGSSYFGPYTSVKLMNTLLDLIKQLYPIRSCNLKLTEKNIKNKKFKLCLEYYIGNCKGPCENLQTAEDYDKNIAEIKNIIKGNINTVYHQLKSLMYHYADTMEFEKAQLVKEKIELLKKYQSKSTVVNPNINNVDVFSIITDENYGYVNFLKLVNGAVIQAHTIEIKKKLYESPKELLQIAITDFRQRFNSDAHEIIIPFAIDINIPKTTFIVPKRGDKKKLLELSERNVKYYKIEKQKKKDLVDPERHTKRILKQMMKDLRMKEPPVHIEAFDNSNIQGKYPVSAMVVFKNANPDKKEYRHFNIKTVKGPDDYASMEEVIFRRYKRLKEEKKPLPQLVVIDGGKGQLNAALKSLDKLNLRGRMTVIGIAKKLEEIFYPNDSIPMYLDKKSETLKVIQYIRDEAHRFGIQHHRKKRQKGTIKTILTEIKNIGPFTSQTLLREYKSVKNIKKASLDELQKTIGKSRGEIVFKYFNS